MAAHNKVEFHDAWLRRNNRNVVGTDECNYSPSLVGDCVACALWLPLDEAPIRGVNDSKLVRSKRIRNKLYEEIAEKGVYCISTASPSDIAKHGIYKARNIAIASAVNGLKLRMEAQPEVVICDQGIPAEWLQDRISAPTHVKVLSLRGAGQISYLVGAASIVAKVYTDWLFEGYEADWPGYMSNNHHGSGTPEHYEALRRLGPSPVHRVRGYAADWWEKVLSGETPVPE